MPKFPQGLGFDLPDSLSRDGEVLADFFERVLGPGGAKSKPHLDHFLFARRERCQHFVSDLAQV